MHLRVAITLASLCLTSVTPGAPARPAAAFTAADLLSMRQIGGEFGSLSLSPDGRQVAFQIRQARIASRDYKLDWFIAPVNGESGATSVAEGGEVSFAPSMFGRLSGSIVDLKAAWSPDGKWIAFLKRQNGEVQVWRARSDGSRQEAVTRSPADVLDFEWRKDSQAIVFKVGRTRQEMHAAEQREGDSGYLIDERFDPSYSSKPLWFDCDAGFAGVAPPPSQACTPSLWVAEFGAVQRKPSEAERRTFLDRDQTPALAQWRSVHSATWDIHRKRAAWFENEDPESNPGFDAPLTVHAGNKRCRAPECYGKLQRLWWSEGDVVFTKLEGHARSIYAVYAWQPRTGVIRPLLRVDGYLGSCEAADRKLLCIHETPLTPRKILGIDIATGQSSIVADPNPEFAKFKLGRVEKLEWLDGFGNQTFAHLVYPSDYDSSKPYPLVVVQYTSRGFLSGGVGNEYPILPLAERQFLVLSFDRPEDVSIGARYKADSLEDNAALNAAAWKDAYTHRQALTALEIIIAKLTERNLIDPKRVGITGLSNGAETVDYVLTHAKLFAAAAVSGNASPFYYYQEVNSSVRTLVRAMHAADDGLEVLRNWGRIAMVYRAKSVEAPLLIQVADRELIHAIPAIVALKDAGRAVEAYAFPDEYHIKWQPQHKLAVAERAIDWFAFWLQGYEDPAAEKAVQYARWKKL